MLLRGNAVNYAVRGQDAGGLAFGDWKQTEPPRIEQQLGSLIGQGRHRLCAGRRPRPSAASRCRTLLDGIEACAWPALPALLPHYERVWHW